MGLLSNNKPEKAEEPEDDGLEIHGDPTAVVAWRIDALVSEGFDPVLAGVIATLSNWRDAKPLLDKGCPPRLVWELLK